MRLFKSILFVSISIAFIKCDEEKVTTREYPRVETLDVINVDSNGATFRANILQHGSDDEYEYGFVWSKEMEPTIEESEKVISTSNLSTDSFQSGVTTTLIEGEDYVVRAFVKNSEYLVYGNPIEFTSLGSGAPKVISLVSHFGTVGDTISIKGDNFSYLNHQNIVTIDTLSCLVVSSTDTLISIIVPAKLRREKPDLTVSIGDNKTTIETDWTFSTPKIISFSPETGTDLTELLIFGFEFSNFPDENIVEIGGQIASVITSTKEKLFVQIPIGIKVKEALIDITVAGHQITSDKSFVMFEPEVHNFTPSEAAIRDIVTITGKNFGRGPNSNKVFFGDVEAKIMKYENNFSTILAEVPFGVNTSGVTISVETAGQIGQSKSQFTMVAPEIHNITSTHGSEGDWITITGDNFGTEEGDNKVLIHGFEARIGRYSRTEILFFVPEVTDSRFGPINVITGITQDNAELEFEYVGGSWTKGANYPGTALDADWVFQIGSAAFFGVNSNVNTEIWKYDINNDEWSQVNSFPYGARTGASALSVGNKGYMGLGISTLDNSIVYNDWYEYDPVADSWTRKADLVGPLINGTTFAYNDSGYVVLGTDERGRQWDIGYRYNTISDQWSRIADRNGGGSGAISFVLNDLAYVGYSELNMNISFYRFGQNNWRSIINQLPDRSANDSSGTYGFSIADRGYAGGKNGFWEYNPNDFTWTATKNNPYGTGYRALTFTNNGNAYHVFTGGRERQVEIFTPLQ